MATATQQLNGLDLDAMRTLVQTVTKDPAAADRLNDWSARVRWETGFRSKALVRDHTLVVDEPATLVGQDLAPNAAEYVLAAFGACLTTGMALNATKDGIRLRNVEVIVEGRLDNILTFFGMSDRGHPGFKEISVKAYIDADTDDATLKKVWRDTVASSPIGNTLVRNVVVHDEMVRV
ncbi:MAG TPA: OsmC family protein [Candidatus Limnocylindria bacterium]|nr:OsmC family protein [Candidatus Limnocylindria bacterium]